MRAKRPPGGGKGGAKSPKPLKSPRGGSKPAASDSGKTRLSRVVPGDFGGHADRTCREWLKELDVSDKMDGHLDSAVLLLVGSEAVLESVCLPNGSDRFRFIGALRLLAQRLEQGMVEDG